MVADVNYAAAARLIDQAKARGVKVATAESCTGGLISASLTAVPGASHVLERAFVTYSNEAKRELLDVPAALLQQHGAVSREVAMAMAEGALAHSRADVTVAVTGIAGPDGGSDGKPVGLVHMAAAKRGGATVHQEMRYGNPGRHEVQKQTALDAMALLSQMIG